MPVQAPNPLLSELDIVTHADVIPVESRRHPNAQAITETSTITATCSITITIGPTITYTLVEEQV